MEIEGFGDITSILYIAKELYDRDKFDIVKHCFYDVLHWENYYEDMLEVISNLFEHTESKYYEKRELELTIHSSKEMVDYYILAGEYGKTHGISIEDNQYIKAAKQKASSCFNFSYNVDWILQPHTKPKRPFHSRIAILAYIDEYVDYGYLALGLIRMQCFFEEGCETLRKQLATEAVAA